MADVELVRFVKHAIPWYSAFQSPAGMVGQEIRTMTKLTEVTARIEAPKPGAPAKNRTGINYSTGHLASVGIKSNVTRTTTGGDVEGHVVALPDYALHLHEGTLPHAITAKAGGKLVFFWHKMGRVVAFDAVDHPGTRANQFLLRALVRVMRRYV